MELLEQCRKWHEKHEHQKIIDALEAIQEKERTQDMDMELARAYNNKADKGDPEGRRMLKRSVGLLQAHEEQLGETYSWNFRIGYAYYCLAQEGRALRHFEKALELYPGDDPNINTKEDIKKLIASCKKSVTFPRFGECFRERTKKAWETFAEQEAVLRQIMDEDREHVRGNELIAECGSILHLAFDEISFEIGCNGEKYELLLTPEGNKVKLFELVYFQKHAPEKVLEHWNIIVGCQPIEDIGLRTYDGWDISGEDVQVWLEDQGENSFALSAYCEKLMPMLQNEEGQVWWMLTILTDQVLGEIPRMRYIARFNVLEKPKAEPPILMSQLPDKLKEKGVEIYTDPQGYLENYLSYEMNPHDDPKADWRLDVVAGSTCCASLINGYLNADNDFMDNLHADGAVAGFFCYPLYTLWEEEGSQKIFDFRDKLEEEMSGAYVSELLTLTGGATGHYCGYVDFIAWDLEAVLYMAEEFFNDSDIPWASFHTFRRDAGSVHLKNQKDDGSDEECAPTVVRECRNEIAKGSEAGSDEEKQDETDHKGTFVGFVLMSKGKWDKQQFIRDMKDKWDITVEEGESDDAVVFEVDDMIAAVNLMPYPIPNGEAEVNAKNNYMWADAVKAAQNHSAQIMVAVLGKEEEILEKGKFYTKLVAACCRQKYATGVYTSGVVFEPRFYEGFADMMHDGELPIFNWIWFGMYRDENGMNAYTYGMEIFGRDEMEVLGTDAEPESLRDFLSSLVSYVLENDVELQDGETIGFSAEDKHRITRSAGVSLPETQMTLKISWESSDGEDD